MRPKPSLKTDIIVVGGGHAGLSLAACLGTAGFRVLCLERSVPNLKKKTDGRTLALSFRTMEVLRRGGVEQFIKKNACPILDIRVADQGSHRYLDFDHRQVGTNPFGWIIENALFNQALAKRLSQLKNVQLLKNAKIKDIRRDLNCAQIELLDGRVFEAALIIGADGRNSLCREKAGIPVYGWDYHQSAIVCTIKHKKSHNNVAVEHFQPSGPFATLPMTKGRSSIVWTEKTASAETLMAMDEEDFKNLLEEKVINYLGPIDLVGQRFSYPLSLQHAEFYTSQRLVLIGDAAHGIHPIAGQGFNLGMGDIAVLLDELSEALYLGLDLGSDYILRRFEKRRKFENGNMVLMTDLLDRLFSNAIPPVQVLRRLGLSMVQKLPPLRRYFMRTAMGGVKRAA